MKPPPADSGHGPGPAACENRGDGYISAIVVSNEKKKSLSNIFPTFPNRNRELRLSLWRF